ncbi:hypothetical protein PHMEG_00029978 [Phytophthora megakarya]|uniref:DDE Tnp4 domain-containing protein n=1 Tax=Phytophthora megakarya TaxID=4795 RepID=A0A225V271_9STRA|nr:hypothetical protein PHMEG_00029978 [Phytophthora megakarya]
MLLCDGVHLVNWGVWGFTVKPAKDGECFFDRKQRYSLNAQVVCDNRRRIISFLSGWPGSCSDSTIYQEMSLSKSALKHRFFSNRWGSVKEIRIQLNRDESKTSILKWISTCVVLHNMLIDLNDPWSDSEQSSSDNEDEEDEDLDEYNADDDDPYLFRRKVKQRAVASGRQPGGILWYRSLQHEN